MTSRPFGSTRKIPPSLGSSSARMPIHRKNFSWSEMRKYFRWGRNVHLLDNRLSGRACPSLPFLPLPSARPSARSRTNRESFVAPRTLPGESGKTFAYLAAFRLEGRPWSKPAGVERWPAVSSGTGARFRQLAVRAILPVSGSRRVAVPPRPSTRLVSGSLGLLPSC